MKREKQFNKPELHEIKSIIFEKTGCYMHYGKNLLLQAFTRSSYSAERGGEDNEVLEFIGDQVLSYYLTKNMAHHFGALNNDYEYSFRVRENRFTALKQELVNNESLAKIIDEWDVLKYLIVGKSDFDNEVDKQPKVKADLLEAIIGAIAVYCKWDEAVLEKAVEKALSINDRIKLIKETEYRPPKFDIESAVNTLKELSEHKECTPPDYEYNMFEQCKKSKSPQWSCTCTVITDKTGITRQVWSSSKKAAKKAAAYLILCDIFDLQNEYGENGKYTAWSYENGILTPLHMAKKQ